jgi:adenylate cyclase
MERSAELESLVTAWFEAATRGDGSFVEQHLSQAEGLRLVGSDPGERLRGKTAVEFLKREVEASTGSVRKAEETEGFAEGTVGWASTRLTITFPDGRSIAPRWTAVLHQEEGDWKFVQIHASIGVPNKEAGWLVPG